MSQRFIRRAVLRVLAGLRARAPVAVSAPPRVCLFKPDRIGDFVLALGAMRLLTEKHGEANCEIVVLEPVAELARAEFPRACVVALPVVAAMRHLPQAVTSWLKWRKVLAAVTADTVVCLRHHRNLAEECALLWLNARHVVGLQNSRHEISEFDQAALPPSLTSAVQRPAATETPHCLELAGHRALLRLALGREVCGEEVLPQFVSVMPEPGSALLLAPFSSSALKDYPDAQLAEALAMHGPVMPFQLIGSPAQRPRLESLGKSIKLLCGTAAEVLPDGSVPDLVRAIARARAVVTVDSAAAHIATAMDKPTVVLHNGTRFGEFGPWHRSARQRWLVKPLDCFGCGGSCSLPQPMCIQGIEPRLVADTLAAVLAAG
ncbi:MAG: glycosyltransferase family 9 protein [Limisphaerales bacterium]